MEMVGLVIFIGLIMLGPPVVLLIVGLVIKKNKANLAKIFFILAAVYVIVGGGLCATILTGL